MTTRSILALMLAALLAGCSRDDDKQFGGSTSGSRAPNKETREAIHAVERDIQNLRAKVLELETRVNAIPVQPESSK